MKNSKRQIRKQKQWRVNYVVVYPDRLSADRYRKLVLPILQGVAAVKGIVCKVSYDHTFPDEKERSGNEALRRSVTDLVYFRSSDETEIRGSDLRKILDLIFDGGGLTGLSPYSVFSQKQAALSQFPFPNDH